MQDNDTPGYLAAGYLIAAEQQRQADNAAYEAESQGRELARQADDLNDQLARQSQQSQEVEADYWQLFNLLKQPMEVIAQRNRFFAQTYETSQQELADVRVRELAFTELAYQLGAKLGMSLAEVNKAGTQMRADVLQNRFPKEHGTNGSVSPVLRKLGTGMLQKWEAEHKAFIDEYNKLLKYRNFYDLLDGPPESWSQVVQLASAQAKQGKREAQATLGYCLFHGKGIERNVDEAEHWYLTAQRAGDPMAALLLHYLYSWSGSKKFDEQKAEGCLKLAEEQGDPYAASARKKWEEAKNKRRWVQEEPQLLERLMCITPGERAGELDRIKGRGYVWEEIVSFLHGCEYRVLRGETINKGTFFSPKRYTECIVEVTNPAAINRGVRMKLLPAEGEEAKRLEVSAPMVSVQAGKTERHLIGTYATGVQYEVLTLDVYDKSFNSLAKFAALCPRASEGYLTLKLRLAKPFVS